MDITTEINPKHKSIINTLSTDQKCEVYCTLNCWEWPDVLGDKPYNWDSLPTYIKGVNNKKMYIDPLIDYIKTSVSEKEISKYWNLVYTKSFKREKDFENWYRKNQISKTGLKILNKLGIYTKNQKRMISILQELQEQTKQAELGNLYGGK